VGNIIFCDFCRITHCHQSVRPSVRACNRTECHRKYLCRYRFSTARETRDAISRSRGQRSKC